MSTSTGKLTNQVAIITGAAQGMGAAIAKRFAQEGAKGVVTDINGEKAEQVAAQINADGNRAVAIKADVTKENEVAQLVQATLDHYGSISILINNAGILFPTRVDDVTKSEWDLVLDVNLNGTFLCSKAVLPIMKQNRFGRIVNMSSSAGRSVSTLGGVHYTTAKAGVLGFTRALAKEVAAFGITVNAVCPGLIDTEMARENCTPERLREYEESFPISRLGTPDEVAKLMVFLAADATYITGASIDINGGDLMM
jgi:NAD(P)-dependent dehydrogenase (short-subunit alcohol dehydrogenase family)